MAPGNHPGRRRRRRSGRDLGGAARASQGGGPRAGQSPARRRIRHDGVGEALVEASPARAAGRPWPGPARRGSASRPARCRRRTGLARPGCSARLATKSRAATTTTEVVRRRVGDQVDQGVEESSRSPSSPAGRPAPPPAGPRPGGSFRRPRPGEVREELGHLDASDAQRSPRQLPHRMAPGRITTGRHDALAGRASSASAARSPARRAEDLPEPEVPTMASSRVGRGG